MTRSRRADQAPFRGMVSNCFPRSLHAAEAEQSGERNLFKGRHFDRGIVVLRARWRLRYKLGWRNLVETMAEPDVFAHTTIMRCVPRHVPEFEKRWNRFAWEFRGSWRADQTYDKSRGVGHISAAQWTRSERPWISSFAPSEMSPPPRRFFVGRSRTGVDRRERSRSRAIKLRVGLLVRLSNSTARGDYDRPHRTHMSGKVNSPRANSEPLEKTAPEISSAALGLLTPMNARAPITWPFVKLHDNLRGAASLKICDLRCEKGGSADVVAHY